LPNKFSQIWEFHMLNPAAPKKKCLSLNKNIIKGKQV
jgi:hypothetical protein